MELRIFRTGASPFRAPAHIAHLTAMGLGLALTQPVNELPQLVFAG